MVDHFKLPMNLMLRDLVVATIEIELYENSLYVNVLSVINSTLLPYNLRNPQFNIKGWLMSRLMPYNTFHYISMLPIIFHSGAKRRHFAQLVLSLGTNCVSLSDHYWLSPISDISFVYDNKVIDFKNKTWDNVNPYQNCIWSEDLNDFLFNDMLFFSKDDPMPKFNNPIFTTNGYKEKKWVNENDQWIMEKRLTTMELKNEIQCLEFFSNRGILTPVYKTKHHVVSNRYQFQPHTIRDGFDTIQKTCLTSLTHQLTPLSWYIDDDCEDSVFCVISQVKKAIQIDEDVLKNFENAVMEYVSMCNNAPLLLNNLGFLVDVNDNFVPIVWSNIVNIDYSASSSWEDLAF